MARPLPPAVPPEIGDPGTLADLIARACQTYGTRPAFESFGKAISFAETGRAARAFAAWLQAQGYRKGDRIALMMPNILAYPATIFGALLGGYTSSTSTRSIRRASWRISSTIPARGCSS